MTITDLPAADVEVTVELDVLAPYASHIQVLSPSHIFTPSTWGTPFEVSVAAYPSLTSVLQNSGAESVEAVVRHSFLSSDSLYDASILGDVDVGLSVELPRCEASCAAGFYAVPLGQTGECGLQPNTTYLASPDPSYTIPVYTYGGNESFTCTPCPAGYFCSGSCQPPSPCPPGTVSLEWGAASPSACQLCENGTFSSHWASSTCSLCPSGYSCSASGEFEACPAGTYSPLGDYLCTSCPSGWFSDSSGSSECQECPEGYYCPVASNPPTSCPPDMYSLAGAVACEECPAGYSCQSPTDVPEICPNGTFSLAGWRFCLACPAGFECLRAGDEPQSCGPGYYSPAGESACSPCPEGMYSNSTGAEYCEVCPAGHRCPQPYSDPVQCAAGTVSSSGSMVCQPCATGMYQTLAGQTHCNFCPSGTACEDPAAEPVACPGGSKSAEGEMLCTRCAAGTYASPPSLSTECLPCPLGYICPDPSRSPERCPAGTSVYLSLDMCYGLERYFNESGAPQVLEDCLADLNQTVVEAITSKTALSCPSCPAGFACPDALAPPVPCEPGQYASSGSTTCLACPSGYSCESPQLDPVPCSSGFYSMEGESTCHPCPAGFYCETTDDLPRECPPHTYSLGEATGCLACFPGFDCGRNIEPQACPMGSYSLFGQCTPCPPGYACPNPALAPVPCDNGTYSATFGQLSCKPCPAGYSCAIDAFPTPCAQGFISLQGHSDCTPCLPGYYCPGLALNVSRNIVEDSLLTGDTSDLVQELAVERHTYSPEMFPCPPQTISGEAAVECTPCPAGYACPTSDTRQVIPCGRGWFSIEGDGNCTICPYGYACSDTDGSNNAPCPEGSVSGLGSTECTSCPAGFSCASFLDAVFEPCVSGTYSEEGDTECHDCPAGFACPEPTSNAQLPCVVGTYSRVGESACSPCPEGYSCSVEGVLELCYPGYYSLNGQSACTLCPRGHECPTTTDFPLPCAPGYFSSGGNDTCTACPAGYSCSDSRLSPVLCQVGYFSPGATTDCFLCKPGYRCPAGSNSSTPLGSECPLGGYCNPADTFTPCPGGTYGTVEAGTSLEHACAPCPEGRVCPEWSTIDTIYTCPRGYFCPAGTGPGGQIECPAGTYQPLTGQSSLDACLECPEGHFCSPPTSDPYAHICPQGYFCPNGTVAAHQYPCPAGTHTSGLSMRTSIDDCVICPAGYYCPSGSGSPLACPEGTYSALEELQSSHQCTPCPARQSCASAALTAPSGDCEPGYYCPTGTGSPLSYPCPAGTFTTRDDLANHLECDPCPAGLACPQGTGSESNPLLPCAYGHYCPESTMGRNQFPCAPGYYGPSTNLTSQSECTICPAGFHCTGGEGSIDGTCAQGHYCPEGTVFAHQNPCPAGRYTSSTEATSAADCSLCPPGTFCTAGSIQPTPCPMGTYVAGSGSQTSDTCNICPAGYACPGAGSEIWPDGWGVLPVDDLGLNTSIGTVTPSICSEGFTSAPESGHCDPCPSGFYCDTEGLALATVLSENLCPEGLFCPEQLAWHPSVNESLLLCPLGHYCPTATETPLLCKPGSFADEEGVAECFECLAGSYCLEGADELTGLCHPGFFCPPGSSSMYQEPCPLGTYNPLYGGQSVDYCIQCPAGSVCDSKALVTPRECPLGHYCPPGTAFPRPCPIGTYGNITSLESIEQCAPCDPGSYCDAPGLSEPAGLCHPGFYCVGGSYTASPRFPGPPWIEKSTWYGGLCPRGGYCPVGTYEPEPCPQGTFLNITGASSARDCIECTAGFYCASTASAGPTGPCDPGYYCPLGSVSRNEEPCPSGHYCGLGFPEPAPCLPGTFNTLPVQEVCAPCQAGYYCSSLAMEELEPCPAGFYCPQGATYPTACPRGSYNPHTYANSSQACLPCPEGQYCAQQGLSQPSGICAGGFYCESGAIASTPIDGITGNRCPMGHYCPPGSPFPLPCPVGSYSKSTGNNDIEDCLPCPPGKACPQEGLDYTGVPCSAGYYCLLGSQDPTPRDEYGEYGSICPTGHYCPEGSSEPIVCPAATYNNVTGASICSTCPAGFYCDGSSPTAPEICPVGFYCEEGTSLVDSPCPRGTYNPTEGLTALDLCLDCPPGKYCAESGLESPSGNCLAGFICEGSNVNAAGGISGSAQASRSCPKGHYCPEGIPNAIPCPTGAYRSSVGGKAIGDCSLCPPGSYCEGVGLTAISGQCAGGHFCRLGASSATPSSGIVINSTACLEEDLGSDQELPLYLFGDVCPRGTYCPEGAQWPVPCGEGLYQSSEGVSSGCSSCPAGYYCPSPLQPSDAHVGLPERYHALPILVGVTDYLQFPCPPGYYCPEGTRRSTQYGCPSGTYNNKTAAKSIDDCLQCPAGMYCAGQGNSVPDGPCAEGFFCSGGALTATPYEDPATNYVCSPGEYCPEGTITPEACTPGYYCSDNSGTATGPCAPGHYCLQGASTPRPTGETNSHGLVGDVCPQGHYCPEGSVVPTPCPNGTFSAALGAIAEADCRACLEGFECSSTGLTSPAAPCPAGYYCLEGTITATLPCPVGHYCPEGTNDPVPCPGSTYQDTVGKADCKPCPSGSFCPQESENPLECPEGYYCEAAMASPAPCPAGTYSTATELSSANQCTACPPGVFCASTGATAPTGPCSAGFYCIGGSSTATPTEGFDAGYTCSMVESWYTTALVAARGSLSGDGTNSLYPVSLTYSDFPRSLLTSITQECPEIGEQEVTAWVSAAQTDASQAQVMDLYVSDYRSINWTEWNRAVENSPLVGDVCPPGHYCSEGASAPRPCPPGSFSSSYGNEELDDCHACPQGTACPAYGTVEPTPCPAGFYCGNGTDVSYQMCPVGHYCPEGSMEPTPCEAGTYQDMEGGTACQSCPPQLYCPVASSEGELCPAGFFCDGGQRTGYELPCPSGTFSDRTGLATKVECSACTPGMYCLEEGLTEPTGLCAPGYFCQLGSASPTPLDGACPPGYYCPEGVSSPVGCPAGTYLPSLGNDAEADCLPCLAGFECDGVANDGSGSQPCPAGYYCPAGTVTASQLCPEGHYCPLGSSIPVQCDLGTYQDEVGQFECKLCPSGFICGVATVTPQICPAGGFCPPSSHAATPCPVGTFSNTTGLETEEECQPCSGGYYCAFHGATQPTGLCAPGKCLISRTTSSPV